MFVWGAAAEGNVEFLRKLRQESSCDLHLADELCRTPLMLAAANNRQGAVKFLLEEGAKVSSVDKDSGWNALHHALDRGCLLTAAMLIREGGDLSLLDHSGATPLDLISSRAEASGFKQPLLPTAHHSHSESSEDVTDHPGLPQQQLGSCSDFIFTLGYGNSYQLGYAHPGESILQLRPRLLENLNENIVGISVSGSFSSMSDGKGDVYVWGHGVDGLLGSGVASGTAVVPQKVQALSGIERVSLESTNAAALNDKGEVFIWGRMRFWTESTIEIPVAKEKVVSQWTSSFAPGRVGFHLLESTLLSRPIKLNLPKGLVVRSVTAAANALYFVTNDNVAWMIGQRIDTQRIELAPRPIQALQALKVLVHEISANTSCVCALTSAGEVFQQDFFASTFHRVHFPKFTGGVRRPALRVIKVCVASSLFSHKLWQRSNYQVEAQKALALTNRGEVFWWSLPVSAPARGGWPPPLGSPQLGSSQENVLSSPVLGPLKAKPNAEPSRRREAQLVGGLAHTFVTDIGVAHRVSAAVTSSGDLYTWGPHQHHHFAPNKKIEVAPRPKRVTSLSQVSRVYISDEHTVAVVRVQNISAPDPQDSEQGVPSLQKICEARLMEQVEPKTAIAAFKWSVQRNWIGVAEFCARFLLSNISMFLEQVLRKLDDSELFVFQQCYYALSPVTHTRLPPSFFSPRLDVSDDSLGAVITASLNYLTEEKHQESRQEILRAELVARQVNEDLEIGNHQRSPTFFDGGGEEGRLARIRTIRKKLSQIQALRERQSQGECLDTMQQEKLGLEANFRKELSTLCTDQEGVSLTSPMLTSQSSITSPSSLPLSSPGLSASSTPSPHTHAKSPLSTFSLESSSTRKARRRKDSENGLKSPASPFSPILSIQSSVQVTLHMMPESFETSASITASPLSSSSQSSSVTTCCTMPSASATSSSSVSSASLAPISSSASPSLSSLSSPPRSRAPSFAAIQAAQLRSAPPVAASKPPKNRPKLRPHEMSPIPTLPMPAPWASIEPRRSGSFTTIQKVQASASLPPPPPSPAPTVRPPVRTESLEGFSLGANASSKAWHPVERALTSLSALQKDEESKKGNATPSVWFNKSESSADDLAAIQTMELVEQLVLEEQKQLEQEIEAAIALGKQRELETSKKRGKKSKHASFSHPQQSPPFSRASPASRASPVVSHTPHDPSTSATSSPYVGVTSSTASSSSGSELQKKSNKSKEGKKRGGAEGRGIWNSKTYNPPVSI